MDSEIVVPFDLSGYKLKKRFGSGLPQEAFVSLYAVKDQDFLLISSEAELQRIARVRTQDDALAYCRLFTSLSTRWFIFSESVGNAIEIFKDGEVVCEFVSGSGSEVYALRGNAVYKRTTINSENRFGIGALGSSQYEALNLKPAKVTKRAGKFIVERYLYTKKEGNETKLLYRSHEIISPDGHYSHKVGKVIRKGDAVPRPLRLPRLM